MLWNTTVPPEWKALNDAQCAAPCMNGGAGSDCAPPRLHALGDLGVRLRLDAAGPAAAERGDEDVGLAPEHALRHAGRAAGVEDVEIVGRRLDRSARVGDALASAAS